MAKKNILLATNTRKSLAHSLERVSGRQNNVELIEVYGVANELDVAEIRYIIQKEKAERNPLLESIAVNQIRPIKVMEHVPRSPKVGAKLKVSKQGKLR